MKACFRKAVEIADVVVMQMSQDDIFNRIRIDAERGKRLPRAAQKFAFASFRYLRVEAGVDDKRPPAAPRCPHEVIHADRRQ